MKARVIFTDQNEVFGDASHLLALLTANNGFVVGPCVEGCLLADRSELNWYMIRPIFWATRVRGTSTLAGVMLQYAPPPN